MDQLGEIAWATLFGDDLDTMLDPNKPENEARLNAEQKQKKESFRQFYTGPGKPFFDHVKYDIRMKMYNLIMLSEVDCKCELSNTIREMRIFLKMLASAESLTKNQGE